MTKKAGDFSKDLLHLLDKYGISDKQFEEKTDIPPIYIERLKRGDSPDLKAYKVIRDFLSSEITNEELNNLDTLYENELGATTKSTVDLGKAYAQQQIHSAFMQGMDGHNIAETMEKIEKYLRHVKEKKGGQERTDRELHAGLEIILQYLTKLEKSNSVLSAQVIPPPSEQLEVRLVTANSLEQFEEYKHDQGLWLSLCTLFFGAMLGIIVNAASGGVIKREGYILGIILFITALIFAFFYFRVRRRITTVKERTLGQESNAPK